MALGYIEFKNRLSSWIKEVVSSTIDLPLGQIVFCDLFAGTGRVARTFKPYVKEVIANDVEFYSYVLLKNYIENHKEIPHTKKYLAALNKLSGIKGFIAKEYGENGKAGRIFFSEYNAQKIDACRQQIESWKNASEISNNLYYFLLASLVESADKVANTASVYGAFLKKIKPSAAKEFKVLPANFVKTEYTHQVFQQDANTLIQEIEGDILYLDPPYNARQYGANYHLLNTIAKYDTFVPKGKTGLPEYYKSAYCKKNEVALQFENLIANAQFKYIFLSYNNEGLMSSAVIEKIMSQYGKYSIETKEYKRFKADKTESRNHKANQTLEYLHILEK